MCSPAFTMYFGTIQRVSDTAMRLSLLLHDRIRSFGTSGSDGYSGRLPVSSNCGLQLSLEPVTRNCAASIKRLARQPPWQLVLMAAGRGWKRTTSLLCVREDLDWDSRTNHMPLVMFT